MIHRINALREEMKNRNIDGIFISSAENVQYFAGISDVYDNHINLIITPENQKFIMPQKFFDIEKVNSDFEIIEYSQNFYQKINEIIKDLNIKRLGFEDQNVLYKEYLSAVKEMEAELVPIGNLFKDLRLIKEPDELENIRKACQIGDMAFEKILGYIKPGISEREIACELEYYIRKFGASNVSFESVILSGARTAIPHGYPGDRKIENEDIVLMDFGCVFNGYCSDMTRTIAVGNASDEFKNIYYIVLEAQKRAIEYIGKNEGCSDVDKIARDYIIEKGFGDNFFHTLGHGVGVSVHEKPRLSAKDETILQPGMVVTVEPGIYIEGFGGVRIEDMVIIKDNGIENLMKSPKELIII